MDSGEDNDDEYGGGQHRLSPQAQDSWSILRWTLLTL